MHRSDIQDKRPQDQLGTSMDTLSKLDNQDYQLKHTKSGDPVISNGVLKINGWCPEIGHTVTFDLTWNKKDYSGNCPECHQFVSSRGLFGK